MKTEKTEPKTIRAAAQAASAKPGIHRVSGATGLYLKRGESGAGAWFYRFSLNGRRREMGLGALPAADSAGVTLAEARDLAIDYARLVKKGIDPIEARRRGRADELASKQAEAAAAAKTVTFAHAAEAHLKAHAKGWKHVRAAKVWLNPIRKYAYPIIGDMPLNEIGVEHIVAIIDAANTARAPEAGKRVRARTEAIINGAIALGQRDPLHGNPASAGPISALRPLKRKAGDRPHYRRLELNDAPAMFRELRSRAETSSAFAAWMFMILTAARPGEAVNAQWGEIDREKKLWRVPASRMKSNKTHVVPLSSLALEILELQKQRSASDAIFPGQGMGAMSYNTFAYAPATAGLNAGSPHGWRSVFRDACGDKLRVNGHRVDRDLAEAALAHGLGAVERSYRRETAIEDRRPVMQAYARWLEDAGDNVVTFPARA
jgi:integrase